MIEEQIDEEIVAADVEPILTGDKSKADAEFQQEVSQMRRKRTAGVRWKRERRCGSEGDVRR